MSEYEKKIRLYFIYNDKEYAFRVAYHAPSVGDEVKLSKGVFKIIRMCWLFDSDNHECQYINVEIERAN